MITENPIANVRYHLPVIKYVNHTKIGLILITYWNWLTNQIENSKIKITKIN